MVHTCFNGKQLFSGIKLKVFDRVKVLISTVQSGPQHERVMMTLVEPNIEGLSIVSSMEQ